MKESISILIAFMAVIVLSLGSCKSGNHNANNMKGSEKAMIADTTKKGKDYVAKYVCPDGCKAGKSDKPGKCSCCGKELVENK